MQFKFSKPMALLILIEVFHYQHLGLISIGMAQCEVQLQPW